MRLTVNQNVRGSSPRRGANISVNLIPKIIHLSWKDKNVIHDESPLILNGLRNLIDLNPNWKVCIHDDSDVDNYLRNVMSENAYKLIENVHIVEKTDIWRLYKLYLEGGLYVDIDRFSNVVLDDVLDDNTLCVLPTCLDNDFSQDIMLSAPGNRIYSTAIDLILRRRLDGHTNTYFLGPQTFMHSVTLTLLGNVIDSYKGVETFTQIQNVIENEMPFIKMYREYPPYDTFLCRNNSITTDWEQAKRDFYKSYDVKHWTGEW